MRSTARSGSRSRRTSTGEPSARTEVAEYREATALLTQPSAEAPVELWERIEESLGEHRAPRGSTAVAIETRRTRTRRRLVDAASPRPRPRSLIAVLGVKVVQQDDRIDQLADRVDDRGGGVLAAARNAVDDPRAERVSLVSADGGMEARIVYLPDGEGYVLDDNLAKLVPGRTYQLWALVGDRRGPQRSRRACSAPIPAWARSRSPAPWSGSRSPTRWRPAWRRQAPLLQATRARRVRSVPERVDANHGHAARSAAFGVYVHVPFCAHRCDYCDFATWTDRDHLIDDYVDACVIDVDTAGRGRVAPAGDVGVLRRRHAVAPRRRRSSSAILDAVPRADGAEVTVECNPDSVDEAKLGAYRAAGVDRGQLGVQSMAPHVLASLGRTHDPANVRRAVTAARAAGFERLNLDLIYGAPGETLDDWRAHPRRRARARARATSSAYALTVEPATPLGRAVAAGTRAAPDDDDQADKYEIADERLAAAGLDWYEVSNWARPGDPCRHNLLYWCQDDYVGIGCAAHGHTDGRRWWNVRTPERYVERIAAGRSPEAGAESLDPDRARRGGVPPRAADPRGGARSTPARPPRSTSSRDARPRRAAGRPGGADPGRAADGERGDGAPARRGAGEPPGPGR